MHHPSWARALALVLLATMPACGRSAPDGDGGGTDVGPPTTATTATGARRTIEVALSGGTVSGGPRQEVVSVGERVRIRATSDVAEELHVHTYDLRQPLQPGQPGEVVFTADIPGRHEVEFERSHKRALTLEVR